MINKKFLLILLAIFSLIIITNYYMSLDNSVTENELKDYSKTFLKEYKKIIEFSNLTNADRDAIYFYKNYPYNVDIATSSVHGIAIDFEPSNNKTIPSGSNFENISIYKFKIRLEDAFWPKGYQLNNSEKSAIIIGEDNSDINICNNQFNIFNIIIGLNSTLIVPENCYQYSHGAFIKKNEGYVFINGTLIIQGSPNSIIFKGSKQKNAWSERSAEIDADIVSFEYINNFFLGKAKLTNSKIIASLENQAKNIADKLRNGGYYTESGEFKYDEYNFDKKQYLNIVINGNVETDVAMSFLDEIEKASPPKDIFTKINEYSLLIKLSLITLFYSIFVMLLKFLLFIKCIIKHNKHIKEFKKCYRSLNLDITIFKDIKEIFKK